MAETYREWSAALHVCEHLVAVYGYADQPDPILAEIVSEAKAAIAAALPAPPAARSDQSVDLGDNVVTAHSGISRSLRCTVCGCDALGLDIPPGHLWHCACPEGKGVTIGPLFFTPLSAIKEET
jgi:hypothetical protein